jgi:predicted DNA-binding protein (MmcQ/YjbR family)
MTHPRMFDADDPLLARVRRLCLAYPEAAERISHGRPNFFTVRSFCFFGGSERVDGQWRPHDASVLIKPDPDDAPALLQDARFFRPAYLGASGWLGLDIRAEDDGAEVAELIDASYRLTAPARLVRTLPAERHP